MRKPISEDDIARGVPRWRRALRNGWLIGSAVALVVYALAGFPALPYPLERYIPPSRP